jgi:hypothetical protein
MSYADRVDRAFEERDREVAAQRPLKLPPGMTWRAGPDKIGHLLPGPGPVSRTRYLCGDAAVPERLAWPMLVRCSLCVAVLTDGGR